MSFAAAAIAAGVGGAIKLGTGLIQRGSANRWLKNSQQPIESMPTEITRNQELATLRANTGMPSEQYNNAMKNIQRQQLLALRRAGEMGGGKGLAILGGINEQGNDAVGNLDARDAQMRVNNEGQLIGVNNQVAGWKSRLFDQNIRQKWLRTYQQKMGELGAGNQNLVGGLDKMAAGGLSMFGGGGNAGSVPLSRSGVDNVPLGRMPVGADITSGASPAATLGTIPYRPLQGNGPIPYRPPQYRMPQYNQNYYGG